MNRAMRLTGLIVLTVIWSALACQAADVEWQVEAGFGDRYTQDAWTPLRVILSNRGESRTGRIVIPVARDDYSEPTIYSVPIDLPRGTVKSYRLLVPQVNYRMQVKLFAGDQTEVRELQGASSTAPEDLLTVVLSSTEGILGFLNATPAPVPGRATGEYYGSSQVSSATSEFVIARARWGELPDSWLGWDGADVVVVADSELGNAEEAELEALRLWVQLGGTLVVTGGARAPALADGRLGDMLPMEVGGTRTVTDLGALEQWGEEPIPRQAALIADGKLREGAEMLLGSAGTPLVAAWPQGAGSVLMTTFDFTAEPVKYWDGQQKMWARMVALGVRGETTESVLIGGASGQRYYPWGVGGNVGMAAGHTEEASLPPLWLVIGFLVAYIVMLVPLNYWFVSRMQRRELAWLTTPLIILLFFGAAYGTGFALRGHQTLLNRVAVIEVAAGQGVARALGFAGIFSPAKMDYEMRLEGTAAAAVSSNMGSGDRFTVEYGAEPKVKDVAVNMWSTRVVQVPFVADLGNGLDGYLEWDGSDVYATVRNNTGLALEQVGIVREGRIGRTTSLAPGQEARVDMIRARELGAEDDTERTLGERALAQLFGEQPYSGAYYQGASSRRAWLTAVHTDPLMPVELIGRGARIEDASVIVARLPVRLKPGQNVYVPAWLVESRIVDSTGSVRQYEDYEGHHITINQGSVTWEFAMPVGPKGGTAQSLEVNFIAGPSPGMYPPGMGGSGATTAPATFSLEAYNWSTGEWVSAALSGNRATLQNPAQCMASDGTVRVRVLAPGGDVELRGLEMSGSVSAR